MASDPTAANDIRTWAPLVAQIAAGTLAAALFFRLQRRTDAVTMSPLGYALALTALLVGALLLGEPLPRQMGPAAALIVAGCGLFQRHLPRSAAGPGRPAQRSSTHRFTTPSTQEH